ncbi:MAG TPA: hypothetical protein VMY37_04390 [Thermoguttaceae bacterium]|nr:hypothetical protein [Thermoguttaceae bacterium]
MTTQEMVDCVKGWITDTTRSTEESLEIAENIHDLCGEWVDALGADLVREAAKTEEEE